MRYVSANFLKEGSILARPIYGSNYGVLLGTGITLSSVHVQRINRLGYAGVYISDDLSVDIEPEEVLASEMRMNIIRTAKESWQAAARAATSRGKSRQPGGQLKKIIMPMIEALIENHNRQVDLIDLKPEEDYMNYHTANVVILSVLIGLELGLNGVQLYELGLSALLHDVGNLFIPRAILEKPGKLTPEEYEIIKSHTKQGFEYLRDNFDVSIEGCMGALQHHENYDGTGYPTGLVKDKISIYGRIIAITDVYDALTSKRPFRGMMYPLDAIQYLNSKAGTMFDPHIVQAFQRMVPLYPSGTCVELNSGVRGIVVKNTLGFPDRPHVRLFNSRGQNLPALDLQENPEYKDTVITKILEL